MHGMSDKLNETSGTYHINFHLAEHFYFIIKFSSLQSCHDIDKIVYCCYVHSGDVIYQHPFWFMLTKSIFQLELL